VARKWENVRGPVEKTEKGGVFKEMNATMTERGGRRICFGSLPREEATRGIRGNKKGPRHAEGEAGHMLAGMARAALQKGGSGETMRGLRDPRGRMRTGERALHKGVLLQTGFGAKFVYGRASRRGPGEEPFSIETDRGEGASTGEERSRYYRSSPKKGK